jgi:hypothetical protein
MIKIKRLSILSEVQRRKVQIQFRFERHQIKSVRRQRRSEVAALHELSLQGERLGARNVASR